MAINSYSGLVAAIPAWLERDDLSSYIDDFIDLAEARINRDIRLMEMEARATATASTQYIALPIGYLEMRNFQINLSPIRRLRYLTPEQMDTVWAGSETGTPDAYTIVGNEIQLAPQPDTSYTLEMAYFKKFDAISSTQSNWLIENAPDIYLYAALLEAAPFIGDDNRIPIWLSAYQQAVRRINTNDKNARYSGSALRMVTDTGNPP